MVISRLKLSFETLLANEKYKIVNALHYVIPSVVLMLREALEPGVCSPRYTASKAGGF